MILLQTVVFALIGGLANRLRGGLFSNWMRAFGQDWLIGRSRWYLLAFWALPSAAFCWWLTSSPNWMLAALTLSFFLSFALLGHGAHMIFDNKQFIAFSKEKTEQTTEFWLPEVFGGIPDSSWSDLRVTLYNLLGMSFIGLLRNTIAVVPLFDSHLTAGLIFAACGLLQGPLYLLGWKIKDGETSEIVVGAFTWAALFWILK